MFKFYSTIRVDEFTARLFKIYDTVTKEGLAQVYKNTIFVTSVITLLLRLQKISLGLIRSDYLLDSSDKKAKQVEINMIASSFGALTTHLPEWHKLFL